MHVRTPLVRSTPLSLRAGRPVWLKLENVQPSGSFKLRGLGFAARRAVERGASGLVSSSGGNAGLAVAVSGRALGVPVTVVVPETTRPAMIERLRAEGASVQVFGAVWDEAHERATSLALATGGALMHPFDDPDVWEGHATLIEECAEELESAPGALVVAVGGGGLLVGVAQGARAAGWGHVPILAAETTGAASFAAAMEAGQPVTTPITSLATSLGARRVCEAAAALPRERPIRSVLCSDEEALAACRRFADDHRMLVEPACGAALHAVDHLGDAPSALVVVCGGAGVSLSTLTP